MAAVAAALWGCDAMALAIALLATAAASEAAIVATAAAVAATWMQG